MKKHDLTQLSGYKGLNVFRMHFLISFSVSPQLNNVMAFPPILISVLHFHHMFEPKAPSTNLMYQSCLLYYNHTIFTLPTCGFISICSHTSFKLRD